METHQANDWSDGVNDWRSEKKYVKNENKLGKTMFMVVLTFSITHCPYIILRAIHLNAKTSHPWETIAAKLLIFTSVVINPLLYIIYFKKYRQAIAHLFKSRKNSSVSFRTGSTRSAKMVTSDWNPCYDELEFVWVNYIFISNENLVYNIYCR